MKTRRTAALLLLLPLAGFLAVGCPFAPGKTKGDPPKSPYLPQSSPLNCMLNLQTAYIAKDYDEYIKLLSDDFTFYFCPADAHRQDDPTPDSWGIAAEKESAFKLFTSDTVDKIELDWGQTAPADSAFDDFSGQLLWKIVQGNINLRVHTTNTDGTPLIYSVDSSVDWFYFKEYPDEKASDGHDLWRIWAWKDQPASAKLVAAK
jgi:hypothetical protein